MITAPSEETSWQRAVHHPVSLLGFVIMFSGVIVGNTAITKMMKVVNDLSVETQMFSSAEETDPPSGKAARAMAIKKYRETQPEGRLYQILQFGWVLNGIGFVTMLGGVFIQI